ncbi:MAG: hypothetical protein AAGI23_16815 [Bacteroidota bacterium]
MKFILPLFLSILFTSSLFSQGKDIYLVNASFEGEPSDATIPVGWFACAPGTTPDILPGPWGVYQEATEGETFIGLITRGDGSFESIGQRLASPLKRMECYSFSMDLAYSNTYAGYNRPIKVRVWAGKKKCEKRQLLAESEWIEDIDWNTYNFQFTAKENYFYLIIEAFYEESRFSHQGNILIDNVSALKWCTRA